MENKASMCAAYHMPIMTYEYRRKRGWEVHSALKTPVKHRASGKPQQDHMGTWFESLTAMCLHYGLDTNQYSTRKRSGWSLEKILTTPVRNTLKRPLDIQSSYRVQESAKVVSA